MNRAQPSPAPYAKGRVAMSMEMADAPGFEEKAFFEYHLYTLGRPTTLPNNSTKQIELFDAASRVPASKKLIYYGALGYGWGGSPVIDRDYGPASNNKVDVSLAIERVDIDLSDSAEVGEYGESASGVGLSRR